MFSKFSTRGFKEYIKAAKGIPDENWTGSYTRPWETISPSRISGRFPTAV